MVSGGALQLRATGASVVPPARSTSRDSSLVNNQKKRHVPPLPRIHDISKTRKDVFLSTGVGDRVHVERDDRRKDHEQHGRRLGDLDIVFFAPAAGEKALIKVVDEVARPQLSSDPIVDI